MTAGRLSLYKGLKKCVAVVFGDEQVSVSWRWLSLDFLSGTLKS